MGSRALLDQLQMRKKNIIFHGFLLCFYIIAAVTTFVIGSIGLAGDNDTDEEQMNFNIFTYTIPFVAFILDHSTKKLINLNEKNIYVVAKLLVIIYYLGVYVLALQQVS